MTEKFIVERLVLEENREEKVNEPQPLAAFRNKPVWVLLGEPGAGKSTSLKQEEKECGEESLYLSIRNFLDGETDDDLRNKTLFLDGLDEIRASAQDGTIILKVKKKLSRLGKPKFRISCRAADWLGSSDIEDLTSASQKNEITLLSLIPLNKENTISILKNNWNIDGPELFLNTAKKLGFEALLENPQTLEMLVKAVEGGKWPENRLDAFLLGCEKLVEEPNRRYRDMKRNSSISKEQKLEIAGHLFALMLLSDQDGVAMDQDVVQNRFPCLDDYLLEKPEIAHNLLGSNLFRIDGEELLKPAHRSIAEFLAAQWLTKQIDTNGLPLGRVLNLLVSWDGRAVSGLRGLYAWLAILCETVRERLIKDDALTIVAYGDVSSLSKGAKQNILKGLQEEARKLKHFHKKIQPATPFGALADKSLLSDFSTAFDTQERNDSTQAYIDFLLTILREGKDPFPELSQHVLSIIHDENWSCSVRINALKAWLKHGFTSDKAVELLDEITHEKVKDEDDQMAGTLLTHLYPESLSANNILNYLRPRRKENYWGSYLNFWKKVLIEKSSDTQLRAFLKSLEKQPEKVAIFRNDFTLRGTLGNLVRKNVLAYGDNESDETLLHWLSLCFDEFNSKPMENEYCQAISSWLNIRSERYKGLFRAFIEISEDETKLWTRILKDRISGTTIPDDLGVWFLGQASEGKTEERVKIYLKEALHTLIVQEGNAGLTIEKVFAWAANNPIRTALLEPLLQNSLAPEYERRVIASKKNEEIYEKERNKTVEACLKEFPSLKSGTAAPGLLNYLATVWDDENNYFPGKTLQERFQHFGERGKALLEATRNAFMESLEREDLPGAKEIIDSHANSRSYYLERPCLIGMKLRWENDHDLLKGLSEDVLKRMVAFFLSPGNEDSIEWFIELMRTKPELVSEVYFSHVTPYFKGKQTNIPYLCLVLDTPEFESVARDVVPKLLPQFPLRAKSEQFSNLRYLLVAALKYRMESLPQIIKDRLAKKSLEESQKILWLTAGMLVKREEYEGELWSFASKSSKRLLYLSEFLKSALRFMTNEYSLSEYTMGRLIEELVPHAELGWFQGGWVSDAMKRGELINHLINRLVQASTEEAENEINRLLELPALEKLKSDLEESRYQIRQKRREDSFFFLSLKEISTVLLNRKPINEKDLFELALYHLDDINHEIQSDNDDGFNRFWNLDRYGKPVSKRIENPCSNEVFRRLKDKLDSFEIDCQPEADCSGDKRADIRISYSNRFQVSLEAKRDDHVDLWTSARNQLIAKYMKDCTYGIYLVFWFGKGDVTSQVNNRNKPQTPDELKKRLEEVLAPDELNRVAVRIIDVSWPPSEKQ